jgi:hypothetical protein
MLQRVFKSLLKIKRFYLVCLLIIKIGLNQLGRKIGMLIKKINNSITCHKYR